MTGSMVTFGQLTQTAEQHLLDTITTHQNHPASPIDDAAVAAGVSRLTGVLIRFTDEIASGFGIRESGRAATQARHCRELLRQAREATLPQGADYPAGPSQDWRLWAAADALGCGLDILASHFTGQPRRLTGPTAAVITDPDTADHLLNLVGRHAGLTAQLLRRTTDPARTGLADATDLLDAVSAEVSKSPRRSSSKPVLAIPLRGRTARLEPVPGEERARSMAGIAASAARLIETDVGESITTWRYIAQAAAISHHLGDRLLHCLADRLTAVIDKDLARSAAQAAERLRAAGECWQQVSGALTELTTLNRHPSSEAAVDAGDLVLRLGRMLYRDSAWHPGVRLATVRQPGDLAPDARATTSLALAVLEATDAFRIASERHRRAIHDITQAKSLLVVSPKQTYLTATQSSIEALLKHYQTAYGRGTRATTALAETVLGLNRRHPQPAVASQAALIQRRAHPSNAPRPAALAVAGFPTSITTATADPSPPNEPRPPHLPAPARGRRT